MKVKKVVSNKTRAEIILGYIACAFCVIGFAIQKNWPCLVFSVFLTVLLVVACILFKIDCRREFLFDETGIKIFNGENMKRCYNWSNVHCVYYNNAHLSEKEKKKLERNFNIPSNSRISFSDSSRKIKIKGVGSIIDVFLLNDNEEIFDFCTAPKDDFLLKLKEWGVCLHSAK